MKSQTILTFSNRNEALKRKPKTKQLEKLTHYLDDTKRIKGILKKHWTLIKKTIHY